MIFPVLYTAIMINLPSSITSTCYVLWLATAPLNYGKHDYGEAANWSIIEKKFFFDFAFV